MPFQVTQINDDYTITSNINTTLFPFTYSSDGFTALGYRWKSDIDHEADQPIEFWRSQLAFRGFSPRGNDVNALKEILRKSEMSEMDSEVAAARTKMRDAWKQLESSNLADPRHNDIGRENEQTDDEDVDSEDQDIENEDENENEEDDDDDENESGPWDITGEWIIGCRSLEDWSDNALTMQIYSREQRLGRQMYGRFDLGGWNGVLRFVTAKRGPIPSRYKPNDFILDDSDCPSEENPTLCYRWRGIEDGEGVIQLGEDAYIYSMTFSKNGNYVEGTWGCRGGEPGTVHFTGVKDNSGGGYGMSIEREWEARNQAAYDKANRDRWR